ncbi:hypothetical protein [Labrys wisconsinensis]|uniref:Membrane protein n=1 Tax=Labrys wisconsinensis TaxID=425677 RepID=A0ABU0JIW0_9HYPH|nr:hypothetical protein [Labrys wisconsinensis]MDQ0474213.1 putative membrane protein [Labrys wisconsinensis]
MPVILILLVLAAPLTVVVTRQLGRATTAAAGFAAGLVAGAGLLFDQPAWQPGTAVLGPAFPAWFALAMALVYLVCKLAADRWRRPLD